MKTNKFLCFILIIALMLGLLSGCASAQKDEISTAEEGDHSQIAETISQEGLDIDSVEEGDHSQIAETISLEGLDIDSVEYAFAWFSNMVGELSGPESHDDGGFQWYMFSDDLTISIWPEDNVPERLYEIGIFNDQSSLSDENAQQFKNLCLAAVTQFTNDDVASSIAAVLDVGPVTEGAHPYEGNDNTDIYYYPEINLYELWYYPDMITVAFIAALEMDTGFVQHIRFVPSALTSPVPATDASEPLPNEIPVVYGNTRDLVYTYDEQGNLIKVEDPVFGVVATYDEQGNRIKVEDYISKFVWTYDEQGNLIKAEDDVFHNDIYEYKTVEEYKYDDNGNLTWYARIDYNPDGSIYNNATEEIFCQMYGSENRVIKEHQSYDSSEYTGEYTYNAQGVLTDIFACATDLGYSEEKTTKYEYNDRGFLIKIHALGVGTEGTDESTTEYEYNSQDLLIKAYSNRVRSYGDIIKSITATTEYEYNDQGFPISVYTLTSEYTSFDVVEAGEQYNVSYVIETEDQYNYTYDETGKCIMVEFVRVAFVRGSGERDYHRLQFQCDNSGYIYDNSGNQLYPISLPSVNCPRLPGIYRGYGSVFQIVP